MPQNQVQDFFLFALSRILFVLVLGITCIDAYEQNADGLYLANFNDIVSQSYSAINDVEIAPASLISQCRGSNSNGAQSLPEVVLTSTIGSTLNSFDVVNQCGVNTTCILPEYLTLRITSSFSLGAFIVRGSLIWDDETQSSPNQWICAGYIAVEASGMFYMHLESPQKTGWIYIKDNGSVHSNLRSRAFGAVSHDISEQPDIDISGREMIRTWSLLAKPVEIGDTELYLMHDPSHMKWNIGDRIAIAPTGERSDGTGQTFKITGFQAGNLIKLDSAALFSYQANFDVRSGSNHNKIPALQSAEVVNLSRNIVVTGDDFTNIGCTNGLPESIPGEQTSVLGCRCGSIRTQCTMGLHIIHMHGGTHKIQNTRVELCGQRGVEGKYCLHFHKMKSCPDCLLKNNAIENSQQRGIIVHGTHLTKVTQNVLYDVRGAGLYIEDGNEMWNTLDYNVIICPWPLDDPIQRKYCFVLWYSAFIKHELILIYFYT